MNKNMHFQKALLGIILHLVLLLSTTVVKAQDAGRLANLNGSSLFVKSVGEGEPVIVIHGGPLLDHSYLMPYFQFMIEDHQLILFDQRLSGRSSAEVDTADIRMQMFVKDIEALRNHFGLEKVHVIAHSWGGLLAMEYAATHPDKIKSLILISPMPPDAKSWKKEQEVAKPLAPADSIKREKIIVSGMLESNPARAVKEMLLLSFKQELHDTAFIDSLDFFISADYLKRSRLFKQLLPYLQDYDLKDQLQGLEVPTLIIYGSDEATKDISAPVMKTVFPSAELIIIPRSGHFSFIENSENFIQIIRSFIKSGHENLLDIEQIRHQIKKFSQYYINAQYDSLANCYKADTKILPPNADIISGREAIKKRWEIPDGAKILHHRVLPDEIKMIGNYAYDYGYYEGSTRKANGEEVNRKGKYVIVWKKENLGWKIYLDIWNDF